VRPTPFDPWQAQWRCEWGNRLAALRAAPAQPVFHALALLALAAVLLPATLDAIRDFGEPARAALARWPWAIAVGLLAACAAQQANARRRERDERAHGWLSAQPVAAAAWRRGAWRRAATIAALQAGIFVSVTWLLVLGTTPKLAAFGLPLLAMLPEAMRAPALATPRRSHAHPTRAVARPGAGRIWRWQLAQAQDILGPRRASLLLTVLVVLALMPLNTGLSILLSSAGAALTLLLLGGAWQRSLEVLPAAQRWLQAQPFRPAQLLRDWVRVPLAILALAVAAVAVPLSVVGAVRLLLPIVLLLVALALLHLGVVAAERARPRRIPLQVLLHVGAFVGVLQAFPPAVLPLWVGQVAWLARRSLRQ
jgi:hypothetical protein